MSDLPSLFDARGVFKELPDDLVGTLDEAHAAAYEKIKQCADAIKAAESKLALAVENVQARIKDVTDFEAYIVAHFPKVTFMDLWRAHRGS
jgi:hypothetical protein